MLRIAVLDDEKTYIEKIERITEIAMFQLGMEYEMKCFTEVENFLACLQERVYFDIYLLDVEMPLMNGLEVARHIRREFTEPIIIYVTNHEDYAIEAFEVNAYRYIPKRFLEEKLPEAYQALAGKNRARGEKVFTITTATSVERIPFREIYYLKKEGKYVFFVHQRGQNKVRMTLAEAMEQLDSSEFLTVDRSYVVNMNHVISLKRQLVTLKDGSILPVSKPRFQLVKQEIVKYWGDRSD